MTFDIKVIPGARKNTLIRDGEICKVYLRAPAVDGKANEALVRFLADHLRVKKSQVTIIKGLKSRHKTINIEAFSGKITEEPC